MKTGPERSNASGAKEVMPWGRSSSIRFGESAKAFDPIAVTPDGTTIFSAATPAKASSSMVLRPAGRFRTVVAVSGIIWIACACGNNLDFIGSSGQETIFNLRQLIACHWMSW